MTPYRRKFFIKDLFSSRGLLNSFELVQFESIKDYFEAIQKGWLEVGRNQRVTIKVNDEDLDSLQSMIAQTDIPSADKISIDISELSDISAIVPLLEGGKALDLHSDLDKISCAADAVELVKKLPPKWFEHNRFIFKVFVNKSNYKNQINSIVELLLKTSMRFFRIYLDYESLSELTFVEFEDLKFRLQDLANWTSNSNYDTSPPLSFNFSSPLKKVVVKDSKVYVNEYALRDMECILDLTDKENKTGEDIKNTELAKFRSYLELKEYNTRPFSKVEGLRASLIDPYFNKKMTTSYTLLPPITQLLLTIFN